MALSFLVPGRRLQPLDGTSGSGQDDNGCETRRLEARERGRIAGTGGRGRYPAGGRTRRRTLAPTVMEGPIAPEYSTRRTILFCQAPGRPPPVANAGLDALLRRALTSGAGGPPKPRSSACSVTRDCWTSQSVLRQLATQPRLGEAPLALDRPGRSVEHHRGFLDRQPREEPEFDDPCLIRVERSKPDERDVDREHVDRMAGRCGRGEPASSSSSPWLPRRRPASPRRANGRGPPESAASAGRPARRSARDSPSSPRAAARAAGTAR